MGADLDLGKVGDVKGSAQFVVVWDRDNSLSFVGEKSEASAQLDHLVDVKSELTFGVSLGPKGDGATMSARSAASVLGQGLFEAKIQRRLGTAVTMTNQHL